MPEQNPAPEVSVSPTRAKVMHASDPAVGAIARLPQWVVLLAFVAVMALGLIFRGIVGAICFGLVSLVLAWMLYLSWKQLRPLDRMARATVLVLTVAVTIVMFAAS